MATYFVDDFSDLSGWTKRWNTTPTWTGANPLQIPNGVTNDWVGLTLDAVDSDADRDDVELLVKFTTPATINQQRILVLRGSGADESATHYHFSILASTHSIGVCNGSDSRTNLESFSASYTGSTTYWARFRANGTTLQTRVWLDGDPEPGSPQINRTDTTLSAGGWVGFSAASNITGATIHQIGIGTNGDTAPASAGLSGISGSVSKTLGGASVAAAGVIKLAGSASITLGGAALSASADLQINGATSATLAGATLSSSGTLSAAGISGALSSSLDGATASAAGALAVSGALSRALDGATIDAAGSGQQITAGALSATLSGASSSAAGALYVSAQVSRALDGAAVSAAGHVDITAALGVALDGASIVAAGAVPGAAISGALTRTLAGATLTASGSETAEAEAAPGYTITGRLRAFEVRGRTRRFEVDQ